MESQWRKERKRAWFLLVFVLLWAALAASMMPWPSFAADEEKKPVAAAEEGPAVQQKEAKSWFSYVVESSGFIGLVILLISIYFVSTVARLFFELRMSMAMPPEILGRCEERLQQRDFKGVFEIVKGDDSFFSRLLTTGISDLPNGLPEARESMERVGDSMTVEMEKKISMLAVIGTLGPMIGLLGTVYGMIQSFNAIERLGKTMEQTAVAHGISTSLVLTFEGVLLSVPAIYFFALFRNRVAYISVATVVAADHFLRQFSHAARSKKPGPADTASLKE
ncbi:MAG: MotA/TolQ/ExbB proton channel family protein [Thermoguttaceae bacterium]|jgi:biopolymer transport protein ExbB